MKIDDVKKACILFEYGSIDNFLTNYFYGTTIALTLKDKYDEMCLDSVSSSEVESEWDMREEELIEAGYTRDDIVYKDWDQAFDLIKDTIYENMACDIAKAHFNSDQTMIPYIVHYIEKML